MSRGQQKVSKAAGSLVTGERGKIIVTTQISRTKFSVPTRSGFVLQGEQRRFHPELEVNPR